jgi:fermentation-respiration switch protein FrsA (DUF1100 family)
MTLLAIVAAAAAAIFVFFAVVLWRSQERVVFQPPGPPYPGAQGARRIDLQAEDGQPLLAYLVGEPSARGLVIVYHGNADLAAWQIPWARELSRRTGRAVLLAEFRGYGGLSGSPTYAGVKLDARAVYRVARETLGVPAERIALYGHSLGSAIAAEVAHESRPEVLILVSPLTSVRDMARRISPSAVLLFWTGLVRVHYDTESLVRSLDAPVWVAHGALDDVIPAQMGRRVFDAARVRGELLFLDDASHNDVVDRGNERYWTWIGRALRADPQP